MWKKSIPLLAIVALIFVPILSVESQFSGQTYSEIETLISPLEEYFTYKTDDYELIVTVPRYINLSTPYDKKPARLNIYLKTAKALSGLFSLDVEGGISFHLPIPALHLFVDIDLTIMGIWMPDIFRLKWPIINVPTEVLSLESGDFGFYASIVPVKQAEVELESLTVGELHLIGSYDIYVVEEPKIMALGVSTEDVIIGEVTCLEQVEVMAAYPAYVSKDFGRYSYSSDWTSIDIRSVSESLYPGDTLTLKTRVEAKSDVYFYNLTLDVYGVKELEDKYAWYPIESLTILRDVKLTSGVVRTEEFTFTIPGDALPGMLYAVVSAKFKYLGQTLLEPISLYDDFALVYLKNKAYDELKAKYDSLKSDYDTLKVDYDSLREKYDELQINYDSLKTNYDSLKTDYETLKASHDKLTADYNDLLAKYSSLNTSYTELKSDFEQLENDYELLNTDYNNLKTKYENSMKELETTKILMYSFIVATVVLLASTSYLLMRMRKSKPS